MTSKPPTLNTSPSDSRWRRPAGYAEVLRLAWPLVLSTGAFSVQHIVDRAFLARYSTEALAAVLPAGLIHFAFVSFFMGTATYANTFVAQYVGAGRPDRVGAAIWQAVYFSAISALLLLGLIPLAGPIFGWVGHAEALRGHEIVYFQILCLGGGLIVYSNALSCFYSGRRKTLVVMWINVLATAVNLVLDYAMIFGRWGFPEMGVAGAALATVAGTLFGALCYTALVFRKRHDAEFGILRNWRFERFLFKRLMRFGVPGGVQFMLDMTAISLFAVFIGRMGESFLAATNVAFNVNSIAFLPTIGLGIAASILVGQYQGAGRSDLAQRATWSVFHVTQIYMCSMAALYVGAPRLFLRMFQINDDPETVRMIEDTTVVLLRFVALFSIFDGMNVVFSSALKGAGDTFFVMIASVLCGWFLMVVPTWMVSQAENGNVFHAWACITIYVVALALIFLVRFLTGKWRSMRVIESEVPAPPAALGVPDFPTVDVDL